MRKPLLWLAALLLMAGCGPPRSALGPPEWASAARPHTPQEPETTPLSSPTPSLSAAMPTTKPLPTPVATPLPVATDDLNILLLGSDHREGGTMGGKQWRTDTLIVIAIRPRAGVVGMLSIPRDLWVDIPGHGEGRINAADYLGEKEGGPGAGPALVGSALQGSLGIPIDAYVRVNFQGLEQIIDTMGGVNVTSDRAFDEWQDDASGERLVHIQVITGTQRMDGQTALGYARSRLKSSDFDRSRRQQQILLALRDAALRPEMLPRVPRLWRAVSETVDTDLPPAQVLALAGLALRLKPEGYRSRVFDRTMVSDWVTPDGAMVLLPDRARIQQVWAEMTAS